MAEVRRRLHTHVPAFFHREVNRLRSTGAAGLAETCERRIVTFTLEELAAAGLGRLGEPLRVENRSVRFGAGPLLLDYMGWRAKVLEQVRTAAAITGARELHELAVALSPLGRVQVLMHERRLAAAYHEFLGSADEDRQSAEGWYLAIPLGIERARELSLAGDLEGAYGALVEVARGRSDAMVKAALRPVVEALLSTWASSLLERPDEAVRVLEQSVAMTDSPRAASLLADLLHRRARQRVAGVTAHGDPVSLPPQERDALLEELNLARMELAQPSRRIAQAGELLAQVERRIRQWPRPCWFCKQRLSDAGAVWVGQMHRGSETGIVEVPRCRHCRVRHHVVADWSRWGMMLGAVSGALVGCDAGGGDLTAIGLAAAAVGGVVGVGAGLVVGAALGHGYRVIERVLPESVALASSEYLARLQEGWKTGPPPAG
jgi:hypothetical protein